MIGLRTLSICTIVLLANLSQVCEGLPPPFCGNNITSAEYFCDYQSFLPTFALVVLQLRLNFDVDPADNIDKVDLVDPVDLNNIWCGNIQPSSSTNQAGLQSANGAITFPASTTQCNNISAYPQSIRDDFIDDFAINWCVAITTTSGCILYFNVSCSGSVSFTSIDTDSLKDYFVPPIPECPVLPWTTWSDCPQNCGGMRSRSRTLNESDPVGCNTTVTISLSETEACGDCQTCNATEWSEWTNCSKPCVGTRERTRMNLDRSPNCTEVSENEKENCVEDCAGYYCSRNKGKLCMNLFTTHHDINYIAAMNYSAFTQQNITSESGSCNFTDTDGDGLIDFTLCYNSTTGEAMNTTGDPPESCGVNFENGADGLIAYFAFRLKQDPMLDTHVDSNVHFHCANVLNTHLSFDTVIGPPAHKVVAAQTLIPQLTAFFNNMSDQTFVPLGALFCLELRVLSDTSVQHDQRITFASVDYCEMKVVSDPDMKILRFIDNGCAVSGFPPGHAFSLLQDNSDTADGDVAYKTGEVPLFIPTRMKPGPANVTITCVLGEFCIGGISAAGNEKCFGTDGTTGFPACSSRRKRSMSEFRIDEQNRDQPRMVSTEFTINVEEEAEKPKDNSQLERVQQMRIVILSSLSGGFIVVIIILSILLVYGIRRRRRLGKTEGKKSISSRSPPPPYTSY